MNPEDCKLNINVISDLFQNIIEKSTVEKLVLLICLHVPLNRSDSISVVNNLVRTCIIWVLRSVHGAKGLY